MEQQLHAMLEYAIKKQVSDIHFTKKEGRLSILMREPTGMKVFQEDGDVRLLTYLRYQSRLDLSSGFAPQTGHMESVVNQHVVSLRFAYLATMQLETGVLRVLNQALRLKIDDLSFVSAHSALFKRLLCRSHGLILLSGPTGCGKTTTLYTMLEYMKEKHQRNIITLEDPIEIHQQDIIQIQINEAVNLSYSEGLKQILRHDPDVIMIGEIRDAQTAKMVLRCALTGHLVLSTIHAKDCEGAIARMLELDVGVVDLLQTLICVSNQRIFQAKSRKGKVCTYEFMEEDDIAACLQGLPTSHTKMGETIDAALKKGLITNKEANKESLFHHR